MDSLILNHQPAPSFKLPDLNGQQHTLSNLAGKVVIINFWSSECPHAKRTDQELRKYIEDWSGQVALLSIASNANESPEQLQLAAIERNLPVVLHDAHQRVADLYGAITTPHLFVIDPNGILRYQGAFDDITFRQRNPTRHYLRDAVEAVLEGRDPNPAQSSAYGCSIVRHKI